MQVHPETRKGRYIRLLENPTYNEVAPIIKAAFLTPYLQYNLEDYHHSGVNFSEEDFDRLQEKGAQWLMAYRYNDPIGCVAIYPFSQAQHRIHKLAVLPEHRGIGLGKLLMWHAERLAFDKGARRISLSCLGDDQPLVAFYKGLGYVLKSQKIYKKTNHTMAFLEKKIHHLVDQVGSQLVAYQLPKEKEVLMPVASAQVVLVYHPEEVIKQSNSGHVIQRVLPNNTKEILWHRNTIGDQMAALSEDFETVLLYPSPQAVAIDAYRGSGKPLRIVALDATWQQAQKMMSQSPVLHQIPHVKLAKLPKSLYRLRKNQKNEGLCTLEAVAHALNALGHQRAKERLFEKFALWMNSLT